jgi:hypothetical protein
MKKKFFGAVVVVAIAVGAMINMNLSKSNNKGDLALANVEALADGETVSTYYCCGNTGICVQGPNFVIHGRLSSSPC